MTRRSFFALSLLLTAIAPVRAQDSAGLPVTQIKAVERLIRDEMKRQDIPGLSVAVVTKNQIRWQSGYGRADIENGVPARATTVYRLGSLAKPITAVAVLRLAEQDRLDLDAPLQKYLPDFPQKPWPITTRQLLGHLGGIRHYAGPSEFGSTRHYTNLTETLDIFKNDPLLHEPGTKYSYTTYGYNLLGAIIEGTSGQRYEEYLHENLFQPARMTTMRVDDVFAIIPHRAQGYRKTPGGKIENSALADTSNKIPGGGLCSAVFDLARFAVALQTNLLLTPETRDRMWTSLTTRDGKSTGYGLGWRITERSGMQEVHHGGAQQRVRTFLYLLPKKQAAVALMCNLEGAELTGLAQRIADTVLAPRP